VTKRQAGILTLLALAAFVLAMLTTRRLWFRADLTEGKAYTLSKVSKELYKEIPGQVVITYYLSEKLAKAHPVPAEIEDLLREYAAYSRGSIRVVIQDPVKAGTVAAAERLGVEPQQIQTMEQDESSVATVYTGIVVEYLDRTETIPTAFSTDTLEYDLTARIRAVVRGTTRSVGVIVAAADKTWQADFPFLEKALSSAGYQVREIAAGSVIPGGLSALFVFGGATELDDWALYRIDSYVRSGGRVLFATEGVFVDSHADLRATPVGPSPLLDLLATYGVKVERQLALDQAALTLPIQTQSPEGGSQVRLVRYPHWIALLERYADKTHPVTAHFSGLDLYWASPLTVKAPAGVVAQILASTTEDAWRMTKDFQTNPAESDLFFAEAGATVGHIPLVVALSGSFPSPYLGHPKPSRPGSKEVLSDLPAVAKATRILVVGDGDFATTLIQYSRSERNLAFLVSAADWLGSDDDLVAIRSRAYRDGRLDSISDPSERTRAMIGAQLVNVVVIPLAVVVFGIVRAIKRRKGEGRAISS
jgi:gliding-associated putative ABC transporter substrate-binding component GldG